jgi:DivIVA domain-containing protein
MGTVSLDRESIERKDFPIGRRGYDPEAVDAHLSAIANEITQLTQRNGAGGGESLAVAASSQVRMIVEAAENGAAQIRQEAEHEAQQLRAEAATELERVRGEAANEAERIRSEASAEAERVRSEASIEVERLRGEASAAAELLRAEAKREAKSLRDQAKQEAGDHVSKVSTSASAVLSRIEEMERELGTLVESLRTGTTKLSEDLEQLDESVAATTAWSSEPDEAPAAETPMAEAPAAVSLAEPVEQAQPVEQPAPVEQSVPVEHAQVEPAEPEVAPFEVNLEELSGGALAVESDDAAEVDPDSAATTEFSFDPAEMALLNGSSQVDGSVPPPVEGNVGAGALGDTAGAPDSEAPPAHPQEDAEPTVVSETADAGDGSLVWLTPDEQQQAEAANGHSQPEFLVSQASPAGSDPDIEGARLVALNMALNGSAREDVDRYLAENFQLSDRGALLDEVYSTI